MTTILVLLCFLVQLPMSETLPLDVQNTLMLTAAGLICLLAAATRKNEKTLKCAAPVLLLPAIAAFNWTAGYSEYEILRWIAAIGIFSAAANAKTNAIMRTLCATIMVQAVITWTGIIPWRTEVFAGDTKLINSIWGSFRQHIRYSTIIYAGMIGAWHTMKSDKNKAWRWFAMAALTTGTIEIVRSGSHTLVLVAAATTMWLERKRLKIKAPALLAGTCAIAAILLACTIACGGKITHGRSEMWQAAIKEITERPAALMIGRGADSWRLNTHGCGLPYNGHPHCSLLNMAYDYGLAGLAAISAALVMIFTNANRNSAAFAGFAGVAMSTLTNSERYPEIWFLCAVLAGLAMKRGDDDTTGYLCDTGDNRNIIPVFAG